MVVDIAIKILLLAVLIFLVYLIVTSFKKGTSSIKLMLLGINISLFGGIIVVDPHSNIGGFGYLIALVGILISAKCLGRND